MISPPEGIAAAFSAIGRAMEEVGDAANQVFGHIIRAARETERERHRRPHEVPAGKHRRPYGRNR
ncbi:hypothetical protein HOU25_gp51 [Corynebacterium phage Juicebox]|uniref:Uncharacterized protein n=1 Tax=Corynebacterium phage Juicebox TaxID=2301600 RepID=A0A385UEX9_9CAUD|nr:hypothetical protein HOU25_gp51 [Corynebacterium phage Juicebox]AYB69480.1 hypothetical protein JUICEBOX_51 [Corynebacterium phage Juicebox]